MNITIAMYVGFVVAVFVLTWGAVEIGRRFGGRKKASAKAMNTWVPFKPTPTDTLKDPLSGATEDLDDTPDTELHTRAHQNGHYSESKKNS